MSNWAAMRARMRGETVSPAVPSLSPPARADERSSARTTDARSPSASKRRRDATSSTRGAAARATVERRDGLLDARPARGDDDAMRRARESHAGTSAVSLVSGTAAATLANAEASRLRAMSRGCARFQRACEKILGKRWCSAYEEWLATADAKAPLLPRGERSRAFLAGKLRASGASDGEADTTCASMMSMMEECARVMERESASASASALVEKTSEGDVVLLGLGTTTVRLNREHFDKLRALYEVSSGVIESPRDEATFLLATYAVVARYDAAQGGQFRFAGGHHTALHGDVFDVLRDAFGVSCELFASPLNCRWPRYCSRYFDVDGPFGSLGDYSRFRPSRGSYEVNPPFDENVVVDTANHLISCLESASDALTFVVITPYWINRPCWEIMARSPFCSHVEVIDVREHGYYEGAQHRKASKYRRATSDTSVIFLQTSRARETNAVTAEKIELMREAFRPKTDESSSRRKKKR